MKPLPHERRIQLFAWLAGLPGSAAALILIWTGSFTSRTQWTLTVLIVVLWFGFALGTRGVVVFPLQTLSNLLGALREEDFSIRARGATRRDSLGEVFREVNALGETLRKQRLGAVEATALLRKVMEEIDVAVFAFDGAKRLRLVNRAGERLLNQTQDQLLGREADELGLAECLEGESARIARMGFPGKSGRWEIHLSSFREGGLPHHLLVMSDLSRALREEEREAWKRLIRVLGHEMNNSLAPVKSVAESLGSLVAKPQLPRDWREDMSRGLALIASRSDGLSRFMNSYARLARLPPPKREPMDLATIVRRTSSLETRLKVAVRPGPELRINADPDQIEQLLINLLRNAVDAALETGGGVKVGWQQNARYAEIIVEDEGPGIPNASNLFVPFFTTKPGGSGIGLVLCREIAEGHGGTLTLENRKKGPGCEARLRIPL